MPGRNRLPVTMLAVTYFCAVVGVAQAQTGRIQGVVRDESGRPVRGASVVAENPNATPSSFKATTDDKGRWAMIGLRGGNWTFKAAAAGYQTATGAGRIETVGTNPNLEFKLVKASGEGTGALAGVDVKGVQADLASADALLNTGKYDEAVSAYRAILAKAPALTALKLRIGQASRLARDYDSALKTLEEIPPGDPAANEAAREIGLTYFDKGDLERADDVLTRVAGAASPSREVLYALGEVKFARNQPDLATECYQKAAAADPKWAKPLLKLGLLAVNKGDKAGAARYLEQVVALEPASPEASQARTILEQLK